MSYDFSTEFRQSLSRARKSASELQHDFIGPEHALLGLLDQEKTEGSQALLRLGVSPAEVAAHLRGLLPTGSALPTEYELPYTSEAKKALEGAMTFARESGHSDVNTAHMLVALIRKQKGIAAQVLIEANITEEELRNVVEELAAGPSPIATPIRTPQRQRPAVKTPSPQTRDASFDWSHRLPFLLSVTAMVIAIAALIIALGR